MTLRVRKRLKTFVISFGIVTLCTFTLTNLFVQEFVNDAGISTSNGGKIYQKIDNARTIEGRGQAHRLPKMVSAGRRVGLSDGVKQGIKLSRVNVNGLDPMLHEKSNKLLRKATGLTDAEPVALIGQMPRSKYVRHNPVHNNNKNNMKNKLNTDVNKSDVNAEEGDDDDYDYYDDGDDDDDDDDYDDDADEANMDDNSNEYEELNQMKTNAPFQPGDFGDIRDLEFQARPKLRYEEVNDEKGNENQDKDNRENGDKENVANEMYQSVKYNGIADSPGDQIHDGNGVKQDNGILAISAQKGNTGRRVQKVESGQYGPVDTDDVSHDDKTPDLTEDKIYWSSYVESLIPKGTPYVKINRQLQEWRRTVVKTLEPPSWDKCGRPLNGFVILKDGTKMCARYRAPHDAFVYGESLSFFLSRLLHMDNVPGVVLSTSKPTSSDSQWRVVNITSLAWKERKVVALIQWIDHLNNGPSSKAYIPPLILNAYKRGEPITSHVINGSSYLHGNRTQLAEIAQWGTMLVFDYLTGNYDRVASMQDAADKEHDPHIIEEAIRNLHKSSNNGKLWLIDNESGLLDAYELLQPGSKDQFSTFHKQMLRTMCVFQSSLVKALHKLHQYSFPHKRLLSYAQSLEPLLVNVENVRQYSLFLKLFDSRVNDVINWIDHCQTL